jgi:hypothetical protein
MKGPALLLSLLLISLTATAQIYKTTDEQGNVVFTDQPPEGVEREEVELQRTNTAPPPPERPAPPAEEQEEDNEEAEAAVEYGVVITVPADETTIPMGPGNFSVSAVVRPSLGADDRLQLLVDAVPWGEPQTVPSWALTNVFRGAHDITVAVVDSDGKHLAVSEPVRVYVLRPSVNFRNRN